MHTVNGMAVLKEKLYATDDARWQASVERDEQADGAFVLAVKTTGIYCRPTCPAKQPKRENVEFFAVPDEAEAAGYRACKRCRPKGEPMGAEQVKAVETACGILDSAEEPVTLVELAAEVGLSPFHFHRLFKQVTGLTPKEYFEAKRVERFRGEIATGASVTGALYGAGYGSASRFYESGAKTLGMKPSLLKKGGTGLQIGYALIMTRLGWLVVAATESGVCAIVFAETPAEAPELLKARFPKASISEAGEAMQAWVEEAARYVEMPSRGLDLPLDIQGTAFQRQVWKALQEIPVGETRTYSDVAREIGRPEAVRAVAGACARNNISLAIPCHRVVGRDGSLTGYAWGIERKRALIEGEKREDD
ncbi:MAG: bifunctional DNA-binding transcriptional regulator/O6-methylguanine-DNA methyltransferase Ada [Sphingomonadales bacterium]|nr:bifunctional DNA-binding transcriptional regulator/O6-methylguanine-DNA methyltransferase Ada [Sphingomonadales bacterium]